MKTFLRYVMQTTLIVLVTRLEIGRIKRVARELDEAAFIVVHALSDAEGGTIKHLALHS